MSVAQQMHFINDAADEIAELIERENEKLRVAQSKQKEHGPKRYIGNDKSRKTHSTKFSAAKRDEHRAQTALMAYKEALRVVLLERACRQTSGPTKLPDPEEYLMRRRLNPPPV